MLNRVRDSGLPGSGSEHNLDLLPKDVSGLLALPCLGFEGQPAGGAGKRLESSW